VSIAAGGSGVGPDIGAPKRLLDIRAPTSEPGFESRPIAVYVTAQPVFDPSFLGSRETYVQRNLLGRLQTGSGGVTRTETFGLPAVGKAMHIGCDSLRLEVSYRPFLSTPDSNFAMIGWEVIANGSVSGVHPAPTIQQTSEVVAQGLTEEFEIPSFAQTLTFDSAASTYFQLEWLNYFGLAAAPFPEPAAQYAEPGRAFPFPAARVRVTHITDPLLVFTGTNILRWGRHS
jgi:hypothetical protein